MIEYLKMEETSGQFDLINHVFRSSSFICNMCFVSNKRQKFENILESRALLRKSLNTEDTVLKSKTRKQRANVLPDDILLQDLNWHVPRDLTFLETKKYLQELINERRSDITTLEHSKSSIVENLKKKLVKIKEGNFQDKTFIEQMVMLVEKKKREKIKINMQTGSVIILQ